MGVAMSRDLGRCDRVTWRAGGAATAVNADALAIGVLQLGATPAASARRRYLGAAGHQARLSPVPQRWCMKRSQGENSALSARRPMTTITSMRATRSAE